MKTRTTTAMATLARRINDLMVAEAYSQSEIARAASVSQPLVSKLLSGDYGTLRPATLQKLEAFLALPAEDRRHLVMTSRSRDVFISHRTTDKAFARRLAADIQATEVEGRCLTAWLDEAEIRAGQSIPGLITQGLEASRFFALVMTPAYFESKSGWTDAEWHAALHVDPDNRRARIIPILASDCPYVPYLLRHLHAVDMRGDRYEAGLRELRRAIQGDAPGAVSHRGQLIVGSGRIDRATLIAERAVPEADPEPIEESLYCNLLPIDRLPQYVYVAPIAPSMRREKGASKAALKQAICEAQANNERPIVPAFRTIGDEVLSFHDLEDPESLLGPIVAEPVSAIAIDEFVRDEEGRKIVISLLHMAISRYAPRVGASTLLCDDTKPNRFFFGPRDGKDNVIEWRPVRNKATRTVAKACTRNGQVEFWRHQAAYLRIVFLSARFFLQVTPTWVLTTDGHRIITGPKVGRIVSKWTAPERNMQVLYHVRFWTWALRLGRPGPISIRVGDQRMEIATVPALVQQHYGIFSDQRDLMRLLDEEAPELARTEEAAADQASAADENAWAEVMDAIGADVDEDLEPFGSEDVREND